VGKKDRWYVVLQPFIVSGPNAEGEYRARCPLHAEGNERRPSASFNFEKEVWHCKAGCEGGHLGKLVRTVEAKADDGPDYDPFENVSDIELQRAKRRGAPTEPLSEALIKGFVQALTGDVLDALKQRRGLTQETIDKYELGYEANSQRYTIPVRDAEGRLVNVRRYRPDADKSQKMWNWPGHGSPARLYPVSQLEYDTLLLVEGELDALICIQHGLPAISGTSGAATWNAPWSKKFAGKVVYVCYDNDEQGRKGGKKAARSIGPHAAVAQLPAITDTAAGDATDYFLGGGSASELRRRLEALVARQAELQDAGIVTPVEVAVIGSMDSRTNGRPLEMAVTIVGKKNPTYSVPRKATLSCTMDAGPKCKVCPMFLEYEGDTEVEILPDDVETISRFIDTAEDKRLEVLRKAIGAQRCNRLSVESMEAQTVEELFVTSSVDVRNNEETADYTQRRVYNIGTHETATNMVAKVVGTTWPNPRDGRNEFLSWNLTEAQTSIDKVAVTPEMVGRLAAFRAKEMTSAGVLAKCHEIAADLSANVTRIMGRDRMHVAMDLVYHSALHFPFDGKIISRGWLEFLVVGDTRTGKSETAGRLVGHYGLGHIVGCEGATFAGLVGAVKQIGNDWTVTWGEITINDRRLVVLDEASGLHQELISQMSDIRSRGIAQLTKVESQQTRARVRQIWISNPRKQRGVDEKKIEGIDIIEDLIGNPEDIARFDFAMSVRSDDVKGSAINDPSQWPVVPHVYTSELCHELILWCWSRKSEHIIWKPDASAAVYKSAEYLGKRYVDKPPLIQRAQVREKVARLAVAFAMRTFSTDDSGTNVVVEAAHVGAANNFLDKLYGYDNFGYLRISKRHSRNRAIAKKNKTKIKRWLREHPRLMEFLLDRRGSFRAQDLEELAFMQRDEVNLVLSRLSDAKMISKDKSQIVMEPELQELLREIEGS